MKFFILAILFFTPFLTQADRIEKIIGENDLVAVNADATNIPLKYRTVVNAFGHLSNGCTGTHIGNGYVLTAGHCFWATDGEPIADEECPSLSVEWGFREGTTPYLKSQCERLIIAFRDAKSDFAILKVSPIPPVAIAPDLNRRAIIGDTVTVFSHPDDLPLRWSTLCGIEMAQHLELPLGTIQHKCDTNPGSSGATIINALTLKVVGIHDGGFGADPLNDTENPNSPVATGMNYGTFIQNSPLLENLRSLGFN